MSTTNPGPLQRGFRLIDAVILMTVVGIMGSFAVLVIQRVRQSADIAACTNNLRKLFIGCQAANDADGTMPPFITPVTDPKSFYGKPGNHGSVFFFLLYFMDEHTNDISMPTSNGRAFDVRMNTTTKKVTRPPATPFLGQFQHTVFHCPSDPSNHGTVTADPYGYGAPQPWGACSYACNYLVFGHPESAELQERDNPDRYDSSAARTNGPPTYLPNFQTSFPDGLATTMLFAEKMAECRWTIGAGESQAGGNLWGPAVETAQWAPAFAMESPWHNGTTFQSRPLPSDCNVAYPSTCHSEGMNVTMADGSVRVLSPDISSQTFYALCMPNGKQNIGPDY
jgi:prepilin-type processing-associated H-X9-DG protein